MRRILPSLSALQCFESAARQLSFTRAAEELNVTQSAVSRQIRLLEEFLGRALFHRIKQRLVLTEAGESYARDIRQVLDQAEAATLALMAHSGTSGVLNLAILPTFGSRWLVPRLGSFTLQYPEIQLNLLTRLKPFDFANEDIDVAIHFGDSSWPGVEYHWLMGEETVPVCAPSLLAGRSLHGAEDLAGFTLLQQTTRPQAWANWFEAVGAQRLNSAQGPRFEQFYMVIQAALAGLGMAVLPLFLVQEELASGRLVVAIDQPVTSRNAYYLVHPSSKNDAYPVQVFRDWLLGEARAFAQQSCG
jgi:LysR family glycine cleavage system transcriptional activator